MKFFSFRLHTSSSSLPTFNLLSLKSVKRKISKMNRAIILLSLLTLSQFGCTSQLLPETASPSLSLRTAGHSEPAIQKSSAPAASSSSTAKTSLENDNRKFAGPFTLENMERLAQEHNPTLRQARIQIEGERAKALQAGLYPNPIIGYTGEQIGVRGTAGEFQGGFVQQEIVTGGKLRLSREKYLARASAAEFQALAQEYRVINEVRIRFYQTLGTQNRLDIQRELLTTARDRLITVQEMINVGQADQADLSMARVQVEEQQLKVNMAENDLEMEWEWLMTVVGMPQSQEALNGNLDRELSQLQWDSTLQRLLDESPELGLVRAILKADVITIEREKVQPIPNLVLQGSAGRNYEARETVYGLGAFIEVPIFDRNQGTIQQAKADLRLQQAEVRRTELRLRRSLAKQFLRYKTAQQHVTTFKNRILPEAQQRYVARLKSYEANRLAWPAVLESQEYYFLRRLTYIDHLVALQTTQVTIDGLLLVDGLLAPEGVIIPGHIDAVPKPR